MSMRMSMRMILPPPGNAIRAESPIQHSINPEPPQLQPVSVVRCWDFSEDSILMVLAHVFP